MIFEEFKAHPLVRGGQLQTYIPYVFGDVPKLKADEIIHVTLPDGDKLELVVNEPEGPVRGNVFLMHGLGGNSESSYKLRIAKKLLPNGYRVIRHNHRGEGSTADANKGIYHSGASDDVYACLLDFAERWPDEPFVLIGFSLSGTILLNLLGRRPADVKNLGFVKAAMSVCSPVDLQACSKALSSPRNKILDAFFARKTIRYFKRRGMIDREFIRAKLQKPTLRKVDEYITSRRAGFRDASHYYDECSPTIVLNQINIPTLVLAASDDPIVPAESVAVAKVSPHVEKRIEKSGGHMGFLSKTLTAHGDYRWLDSFIEAWVNEKLQPASAMT